MKLKNVNFRYFLSCMAISMIWGCATWNHPSFIKLAKLFDHSLKLYFKKQIISSCSYSSNSWQFLSLFLLCWYNHFLNHAAECCYENTWELLPITGSTILLLFPSRGLWVVWLVPTLGCFLPLKLPKLLGYIATLELRYSRFFFPLPSHKQFASKNFACHCSHQRWKIWCLCLLTAWAVHFSIKALLGQVHWNFWDTLEE